jgi:hypothetical protein
MATTTNYAWETPDDTDLVKDGAAAIRTLGSSIDTTTKALNPSTTLGDIEYRSATANTNTRLPIGTSGQLLTVSGGVPAWTTPAGGGGMTLIATGTGTGSSATITFSSIPSTYKHLMLVFEEVRTSTGDTSVKFNYNSSTAGYDFRFGGADTTNDWDAAQIFAFKTVADADATSAYSNGVYWIFDYAGAHTNKMATGLWSYGVSGGSPAGYRTGTARWRNSDAISSIAVGTSGGFNFGTSTVIKLYGVS